MPIKKIPTRNLKASDVPPPSDVWVASGTDGDDTSMVEFALSFDGYDFFGDKVGEEAIHLGDICNRIEEAHATHPNILKAFNTTGLRMLLFFQQRRERDEVDMSDYSKLLIEAIRSRLSR